MTEYKLEFLHDFAQNADCLVCKRHSRVQPWLKLSLKEACLICEWVRITEHILIRYFVCDADDCLSGPVSYSRVRGHREGQEVLTKTQVKLLASALTYLVLNVSYISPLNLILDL